MNEKKTLQLGMIGLGRMGANMVRWLIKAAIDEGVPGPVLTSALYERFTSRGEADYQDKLLSAMRFGFGGHLEKSTQKG